MSVSNDGMSRFTTSTSYATQNFSAGVSAPSVDAGLLPLTLSSADGLLVTGDLSKQDIAVDGGAALVMTFPVPFMQSIWVSGAGTAITLPIGVLPNVIRNGTRFSIYANANCTFKSPAGSTGIMVLKSKIVVAANSEAFTFELVAANTNIALTPGTLVTVSSFNDIWQATIIRT